MERNKLVNLVLTKLMANGKDKDKEINPQLAWLNSAIRTRTQT